MALHEFMPLADHGNAQAQTYLGMMYANGQGVSEDDVTAILWYTRAAINGNTDAQARLGDMYAFGKGVPTDDAIAAYWKWRAAAAIADKARHDLDASLQKTSTDATKKSNRIAANASNCAAPAYRRDAEHFGEPGTVEVVFLVDANGKALQASILDTSGWPLLDNMARTSYGSCTFAAAKIDGKAVPGVTQMFYEWNPK
jgi:TonB family protein